MSNKKRGCIGKVQNFLITYEGKTVLNFLYSWGAAIVILGALFKLTHLPGANLMLYIGMGTEVFVFFISAFDKPAKTYRWESVFPGLEITGKEAKIKNESLSLQEDESERMNDSAENIIASAENNPIYSTQDSPNIGGGASVVYLGGGTNAGEGYQASENAEMPKETSPLESTQTSTELNGRTNLGGGTAIIGGFMGNPVPTIPVEDLEEGTRNYLERLKEMTETIGRLNEQLASFTYDPDQMEGVNRHISGLNAIFELQLRSASRQGGSVDKVHEQTEKMAAQIEELNKVYARMLQAMTANMINQQPLNS